MSKFGDILDNLKLNLAVSGGAILILLGILLGLNKWFPWLFAMSLGGGVIILWVVLRLVRIFKTGLVLEEIESDLFDVRPGPTANTLKEFLQPLSFAFFVGLLWVNWSYAELSQSWSIYLFIAFYLVIALLNLDYYNRRNTFGN